jgi:hypothetical protein
MCHTQIAHGFLFVERMKEGYTFMNEDIHYATQARGSSEEHHWPKDHGNAL